MNPFSFALSRLKPVEPYKPTKEEEEVFLSKLGSEIGWEWKWERRASDRLDWMRNLTVFSQIGVLACTAFLIGIQGKGIVEWPFLLVLAVASTGSIFCPQYATLYRLVQRQEVHDARARAYEMIETNYKSGLLEFREAVQQFEVIRLQPNEAVVRTTP